MSNNVEKSFAELGRRITNQLEQIMMDSADIIVNEVKSRAPVKSGKLRDSIAKTLLVKGKNPIVAVGTKVPYARYVEFGRNKRPFIYPSFEAKKQEFKKDVINGLREAVRNGQS